MIQKQKNRGYIEVKAQRKKIAFKEWDLDREFFLFSFCLLLLLLGGFLVSSLLLNNILRLFKTKKEKEMGRGIQIES